jgi:hypothetical protein
MEAISSIRNPRTRQLHFTEAEGDMKHIIVVKTLQERDNLKI